MTDEQIEEYRERVDNLPAGRPDAAAEGETETVVDGIRYERLVEVECTHDHRYCSVYGLSTLQCICVSDPVDDIDLEVIRQYCWFATKDVCNMTNSNKRNMLYWWYMTNIYNVCGAGRRKDPPACLKAAIRNLYREEDGWYKVYQPGTKSNKKSNK